MIRTFVASTVVGVCTATSAAGVMPDIYGITNGGALIGIDASTGQGTLIFNTFLRNCESLERDTATGQLFVTASTSTATSARNLYRLNPATGVAALIGNTGFQWVEAMALNPVTGVMYATASSNADIAAEKLATINLTTGVGTTIANFSGYTDVDALACSPAGELFAMNYSGTTISRIDPATAVQTVVGTGMPLYVASMDFSPDGTLFAARLGDINGGGGSALQRIDPSTGAVVTVGDIGFTHVAGIVANVPTPGSAGVLVLAAGALARRRR